MSKNLALLNVFFPFLLLGLIIYFTASTSTGEGWLKKILKFVGLLVAAIPIVGFIEVFIFRETDYDYGSACGKITGLSLLWIGLNMLLSAFK
jgi:hypothetical protein